MKLEISDSHRKEIGKGGGLRASPQKPKNFQESKLPKGLSAMVSCVKKTQIWTWEKIKHTHQYGVGDGRLCIILKKQFAAIVGVLGVIANKMEASRKLLRNLKKHVFWGKKPKPLQIIKRYMFLKRKLSYSHI